MRNFLALLGWSPGGDREILPEPEMIDLFTLEGIQKKAAVFDTTKLEWMNGQYLSALPAAELLPAVRRELERMGVDAGGRDPVPLIDAVKTRSRTVLHVAEQVAVRLDPSRAPLDPKGEALVRKMGPAFTANLVRAADALDQIGPAEWRVGADSRGAEADGGGARPQTGRRLAAGTRGAHRLHGIGAGQRAARRGGPRDGASTPPRGRPAVGPRRHARRPGVIRRAGLALALAGLAACGGNPSPGAPTPARDTVSAPPPEPPTPPAPLPPPSAPHPMSVRLAFVGDINLGTATLPDGIPSDSGRGLLDRARPFLTGDLVVGNFEGVLADTGTSEKCERMRAEDERRHPRRKRRRPVQDTVTVRPGCYAFRTPTALAPRLVDAGFTHLNLANNHSNDYGPAGRASTECDPRQPWRPTLWPARPDRDRYRPPR